MNSFSSHASVREHFKNPRTSLVFNRLIHYFIGIAVYNKKDITEPFEVPYISLQKYNYRKFAKQCDVFIKRVGNYQKGENGTKGKCYSYQFTEDFFKCKIDFTDTKEKDLSVNYEYNNDAVNNAMHSLREITIKEYNTTIKTAKQANQYINKWLTGAITKSYVSKRLSIDFENKTYQKKGVALPINEPIDKFIERKVLAAQISGGFILNELRQGHLNCSCSPTNGRLNSSFTSLAEVLTSFIRINDKKIKGIDLANSQFLLLSHILENCMPNSEKKLFKFIEENGFSKELLGQQGNKYAVCVLIDRVKNIVSKCEITADFQLFLNHSFNGTLYSDFASRTNQTRAEAKISFFAILFGKCKTSEAAKAFKKLYPSVFKITNQFKESTHYSILSIFLQKIESLIFIETIAPKNYVENTLYISKHDSLYYIEDEYNYNKKIVVNELNKILNNRYTINR